MANMRLACLLEAWSADLADWERRQPSSGMVGLAWKFPRARLGNWNDNWNAITMLFRYYWIIKLPINTTTVSRVSTATEVYSSNMGWCYKIDEILWPILHHYPNKIPFHESAWEAYQKANHVFAKAVAADVQDNDLIWVHDYHLMLLPALLRREIGTSKKNVKLGFFLHTTFPDIETLRILPVRREILHGLLQSDLIGFHINDYAKHFRETCAQMM